VPTDGQSGPVDAEQVVDEFLCGVGTTGFADVVFETVGVWKDEGGVTVGIKPSPKGTPSAVVAGEFE
jgi:hypothetical protein